MVGWMDEKKYGWLDGYKMKKNRWMARKKDGWLDGSKIYEKIMDG